MCGKQGAVGAVTFCGCVSPRRREGLGSTCEISDINNAVNVFQQLMDDDVIDV